MEGATVSRNHNMKILVAVNYYILKNVPIAQIACTPLNS